MKEYKIIAGKNFPLDLSINTFNRYLKDIGKLPEFEGKLASKMARKTFASYLYFNKHIKISSVSVLLGHKDSRTTQHYLRIEEADLAREIARELKSGQD